MQFSSYDNLRRCVKRFVLTDGHLGSAQPIRVLDVGGADVNGSYRPLFAASQFDYLSADVSSAPGVDVVMPDPATLPFADGEFHLVVSGDTFEHAPAFWELFAEMVRVCSDDGLIVVIAPSSVGFPHRFPVDCYRFLPDAYEALAQRAGVHLLDCSRDERGPFRELVGVFSKRPRTCPAAEEPLPFMPLVDGGLQNAEPPVEIAEHEQRRGALRALAFLQHVHSDLRPRAYVEVGVANGHSLARAACPSIGIDPAPDLQVELRPDQEVYRCLSQDFFAVPSALDHLGPIDLAYIDGMHLVDNALLDFIHIEQRAHPASVVLIDDIFPNHPQQALRNRSSRHWTGDVWKLVEVLRLLRRDLVLLPVDTEPTGTLLVLGLNPEDRVLWDGFDHIVNEQSRRTDPPPASVLERHGALHPTDPLLSRVLRMMRSARESRDPMRSVDEVRRLIAEALPRQIAGAR